MSDIVERLRQLSVRTMMYGRAGWEEMEQAADLIESLQSQVKALEEEVASYRNTAIKPQRGGKWFGE